ncbi:MAG: hypothetical protein U5J78_04240 [Parasphingorhabdus sp.]|nr:hypothetical protein [Parasphingorhabdus sp.]
MIAAIAVLAERRRNRRHDIERVGFMPWPLIMMMALLTAAIAFGLAIKGL